MPQRTNRPNVLDGTAEQLVDDRGDDQEEEASTEEEEELAAAAPTARLLRDEHRVYLIRAIRAQLFFLAIFEAGGGHLARKRRGGKLVEVLTDCEIKGLRGERLSGEAAAVHDRLMVRAGAQSGGMWMLEEIRSRHRR